MSENQIQFGVSDQPGYWGYANIKFRMMCVEKQLPFVKSMSVLSETPVSKLMEKHNVLSYEDRGDGDCISIMEKDGAYIWAARNGDDNAWTIMVAAKTLELADKKINSLKKLFVPIVAKEGTCPVKFWGDGEHGPNCTTRWLDVPSFEDIKHNYAASTVRKLQELVKNDLPEGGGKLILLHGVPGTGKTYAIRALINDWADRCTAHYILDPERFFDKASYMNSVLLGDNDPPARSKTAGKPRFDDEEEVAWKLIILEDAGELLAKDAKSRTGQGFARLLNITNGLIGQGLKILILITTNEPIEAVHEAVAREGRCLANIYFEPLASTEANKWLSNRGSGIKVDSDMTIADLYSLTTKRRKITNIIGKKKAGFVES